MKFTNNIKYFINIEHLTKVDDVYIQMKYLRIAWRLFVPYIYILRIRPENVNHFI